MNGVDGFGARPTTIGGDNLFVLAGAATPIGTLSGLAYLIDQDDAAVQAFRLSSQTYGLRLNGMRQIGPVKIAYTGTWGRQRDWARNPNQHAATYWLAEVAATVGIASAALGNEVLGASDGRALTSVQTPLASFFRFNGWAGKFGMTPPNGLRDFYATGALTWKRTGPFDAATFSATYHRFRSDRLDQRYGTEWDLLASVKRMRTTLSVRYARYAAQQYATGTDKFWIEADWIL